ncbi:hypothetical protein K491DRAFT_421201 [Lophiostoma macrostomum CBS 122681]|uniref:Uncharacterized protein n=1 Tax=Lophiostoma macrostomum CBS 122681 TaxID=1314788 RepID=A0A6A6T9J1_9PLEO|nr:hypothetical protein K491DRAFT_421201 [Lophiostoma macrostomum CBS 122681]
MSQTRIFHTYPRWHILPTISLLYSNYELYRICTGTHPFISPRLEQAGITHRSLPGISELKAGLRGTNTKDGAGPAATVASGGGAGAGSGVGAGAGSGEEAPAWMYLNGVPIPSFEMLMRPFRRD